MGRQYGAREPEIFQESRALMRCRVPTKAGDDKRVDSPVAATRWKDRLRGSGGRKVGAGWKCGGGVGLGVQEVV